LNICKGWNIILGIVDSLLVAYDLNSLSPISQLPELKGTTHFAVNERSLLLIAGAKRKMSVLSWHLAGFVLKKEIPCTESVKTLLCTPNFILVGFKRHYDVIDLQTTTFTKLVDFEREHKQSCVEVSVLSTNTKSCLLL
jgi:hypothetical protein